MPIRVKTPDGGVANFPDGTPTDQIESALRQKFAPDTIRESKWYEKPLWQSETPMTFGQEGPSVVGAIDALPAVGGMVGGMLGGGLGAPSGPGAVATATGGAALGGGFGESLRQMGRRAIGAPAPGSSLEAAGGIAKEGAIQGAAQAVGGALSGGLKMGGRRVMQSALKPNVSLLKEYSTTAPKVVQTLLDEGVNVTPGGMEKLQLLFNSTNAEIKEAVKNASGVIPKDRVAARALTTAQKLAQQTNPKQALTDVADEITAFLNHPTLPGPLTVPEAQAMKIGTYQQIGKNYGKQSSASVETQKALARGLKEEIEFAIPKIRALNAREGGIMAAQDAVGHRVAIAGNRDPVGFAWVTHAPQTFLAALMDRSPVVKSMLARGMYQSAGTAAKVSPQLIRAAVVALASDESDAVPAQE